MHYTIHSAWVHIGDSEGVDPITFGYDSTEVESHKHSYIHRVIPEIPVKFQSTHELMFGFWLKSPLILLKVIQSYFRFQLRIIQF